MLKVTYLSLVTDLPNIEEINSVFLKNNNISYYIFKDSLVIGKDYKSKTFLVDKKSWCNDYQEENKYEGKRSKTTEMSALIP